MLAQASNSISQAATPPRPAGLPLVVIVQPEVQHYRIPVFDLLQEAARERYEIQVWGQLDDGKAYKGESRSYLRHTPYVRKRVFGVKTVQSPQVAEEILHLKPHVVVTAGNVRNTTSWKMPRLCRSINAACVGWGKVFGYSATPSWLRSWVIRRVFSKFDRVIAYGQLTADMLAAHGIPSERIYVANNTIDTSLIFSQETSFREKAELLRKKENLIGKKILLMICRLEPAKRPGDILDAWPQLRELDDDLTLVIAGGGTLAEDVKKRAASIDPDRIRFVGNLPTGEDYTWIAASDMTIQCGAIGLAINQSMAFGKATIIADEFGPDSEIVQHGITGWRYRRGDLGQLINTVAEVLQNAPSRERIVHTARERMRSEITIEHMVRQLDRCITEALQIAYTRRNSQ